MKKTLVAAVTLAACAASQLFAQNVKEGNITFAMYFAKQVSVSTSKSQNNAGLWSQRPQYYKTVTNKLDTAAILRSIAFVLHNNANYYSSKAKLVLVQGELGGFFNVTDELALSAAIAPDPESDVNFDTFDFTTFDSTIQGGVFAALATGRNYEPVPDSAPARNGAWPPGHHQIWGQIFVKDPGKTPLLCENVTFFFSIKVTECYDCFYLNSFISDASFTFKPGGVVVSGPPCCAGQVPSDLSGCGKDQYYMSFTFDNTWNNPYLQSDNVAYVGYEGGPYPGIEGIRANNPILFPQIADRVNPKLTGLGLAVAFDGLTPDFWTYVDPITSVLGLPSPYEMRFTLDGIVTYSWCLKFITSGDVVRDFVGTANYVANGNGFIGLFCGLLRNNGGNIMSIAETTPKASSCCTDIPWYDWWYGVGYDAIGNSIARTELESPVNLPVDLSYHAYQDENYEPAVQWPNPGSNYPPPSPTGFLGAVE
jgi:hypothetical protein